MDLVIITVLALAALGFITYKAVKIKKKNDIGTGTKSGGGNFNPRPKKPENKK